MNTIIVPSPDVLRTRILACRTELADLKKLLRLSEAAAKTEAARASRQRAADAVRRQSGGPTNGEA
jgi:hypothetical protein